jgi:hypothetical protein
VDNSEAPAVCLCSCEWRVLFIAVGGRWSVEVAGAMHDRTSRFGRTYDLPPFIMDGPGARSLVSCELVSLVDPVVSTQSRVMHRHW